ncbi:PREDICTED: pathogenesis-related protein PRB1-3-like [Ipomoea nil]|uniref:pathogenesis-related protein PRB1-3-like n=2 Tax=Ipomoea nil TaxID=35883 RepID=UPI000900B164|nr:PREDICTED: pathogenesis-related protein PRB1-3-like [Ipomoea nil]
MEEQYHSICETVQKMEASFAHFSAHLSMQMCLQQQVHLNASASVEPQVLLEFKEYATEVDVDFVRRAVRAIGRCAIKLEKAAERSNHNKKEMEFSFLQLTISIIALAAIAQTSFVQSACDSDCVKGFVAAHNAARQTVGSPPVNWNSTLADIAESYAAKRSADCVPQNSNGLYGENIAVASAELSPADSMKLWMGEKKDYDHASNSCTSGNNCRSYTQVVWGGSTSIGCARVTCKTDWMFVICYYNPPGNYMGEKPY